VKVALAGWGGVQVHTLCASHCFHRKGWHSQSQNKKYQALCKKGLHFRWFWWRTGKRMPSFPSFDSHLLNRFVLYGNCHTHSSYAGSLFLFFAWLVPTISKLRERCCGLQWPPPQCFSRDSSRKSHCMNSQHLFVFSKTFEVVELI